MSYELISAPSSQEAVMTSIRDFAVAEGWTLDNFTAASVGVSRGVMTLHRGSCYVSFRWEGTESEATKSIAMYQSLGYSGGSASSPWLFTDDSGNGTTSASTLSANRRVSDIGSGPFVALHLFGSDTDEKSGNSAPHIYAVLEYAPGKYRHFAFGTLDKFNDYTGGEFVAGHEWDDAGSNESNPLANDHTVLLDGIMPNAGDNTECGTVHVEGLPGQGASSKWGVAWDGTTPGNDRAAVARVNIVGGVRRNLYTYFFGRFVPDSLVGFFANMPIPIFYKRDTGSSNARYYLLGHMPNLRHVSLRNLNPGDEITIGSITYKVFPVVSKANLGGSNNESENMGLAYAKVA